MFTFYSCKVHHTPIGYSHYPGDRELRTKCTELADERADGFNVYVTEDGVIVAMSNEDSHLDEHGAPFHSDTRL